MVGMGGTGAAVVLGTAGVLLNPSATGIPRFDISVGGGFQTATFEVTQPAMPGLPPDEQTLFSISGAGLIAGATWLPRGQRFRIAAAIDGPID